MTNTWYVLQCKPRKEDVVYKQLCTRGIETFYPRVRTKNTYSHKFRFKPYFPGYLFIYFDVNQHQHSELKWLPGSIDLVSVGGEPACVPHTLIHTIRQKVDKINAAGSPTMEEQYKRGDPVVILKEPLDGFKAIFDAKLSGTERVRVLLQCLHRQIWVDLPEESISRNR